MRLVQKPGLVIGIAAVFSAKYNFDSHRFSRYVVAIVLVVCFTVTGAFRALFRAVAGWFNQGTTRDDEAD